MKIKLFYNSDSTDLENDVNLFLNSNIKVIDIKSSSCAYYNTDSYGGKLFTTITVLYEDQPKIRYVLHKDGEEE